MDVYLARLGTVVNRRGRELERDASTLIGPNIGPVMQQVHPDCTVTVAIEQVTYLTYLGLARVHWWVR